MGCCYGGYRNGAIAKKDLKKVSMKRRLARECALQFLYGFNFCDDSPEYKETLQRNIENFWIEISQKDVQIKIFTEDLILGTIKNVKQIDEIIERIAEKWKLQRLAIVDKTILRFAIYEILFRDDIPKAVSINESIEIAKKFSTSESASFINGILDKVLKKGLDEKNLTLSLII